MKVIATSDELRAAVGAFRAAGEKIALVPTMGNLHAGHARLVARGRELAGRVIVSSFVNPLQFGPNEDFARYPRTPEDDRQLLERLGVDIVYAPQVDDIYPFGLADAVRVEVPQLSVILEGEHRPGHFTGVATVVAKLLLLVGADYAVFGEKDFQQLAIISRMAEDLFIPTRIIRLPTVRDTDGLAMSSRNRYLTAEERQVAPRLYAVLSRAREEIIAGGGDYAAIENRARTELAAHGFRPDYVQVRAAATLTEPQPGDSDLVILAAAWLGRARLIDNVRVSR